MSKSEGANPETVSLKLPATRSRFRGPYRALLLLTVLFGMVVFVFPLLFDPSVEAPPQVTIESPFSVGVRISNHNLMPITDVEYSCEVSKLTLATGVEVKDAKILIRGTVRKFDGRKAITAPCETAYIVNAPIKQAEYTLALSYRMYPWRQRRASVSHIVAQIDGNGRLTGWKVN